MPTGYEQKADVCVDEGQSTTSTSTGAAEFGSNAERADAVRQSAPNAADPLPVCEEDPADCSSSDSAAADVDAGAPTADAGAPTVDGNAPDADAGAPTTDAGAPEVDGGAPATDAGAPATADEKAALAQDSLDQLRGVPKEEQACRIDDMDKAEFDNMIHNLPRDDKESMKDLIDATADPERKLQMWAEYHKAHADNSADAELAKLDPANSPTDAVKAARIRAAAATEHTEADDEVDHLMKKVDRGESVDAEATDLMARKKKELDLEMKYGVNLTNDSDANIAARSNAADRANKTRRTWSSEDLDHFDEQLGKLPPEHVQAVTEFRRTSHKYNADGTPDSGVAYHYPSDHSVDVCDGGSTSRAVTHEIGHEVSQNHPAEAAAYKTPIGSSSLAPPFIGPPVAGAPAAATPTIPDDVKTRVDAAPAAGAYGDKSITKDGKVYVKGSNGNYSVYDDNHIPRVGEAEKTSAGWRDEYEYGRHGGDEEMFADHYKLAVQDPVRVYSDFVDAPQEKVTEASGKVATLRNSGASTAEIDKAQKELDEATAHRDGLKSQYDTMREKVFKVDGPAVDAAASGIPAEQQAAFKDQAAHCQTPAQLAQLQADYQAGIEVNPDRVEAGADAVAAKLPPEQVEAFKRDARNCFTAEQLDHLRDSYLDGDRQSRSWTPQATAKSHEPVL